jgi:hypothetical protein
VSSVAFLQAEYLAAAFCYLIVLATFAVPPVLLFKALEQSIRDKGLSGVTGWDKGWLLVVSLWFYLTIKLTSVFLPDSLGMTNNGQRLLYLWLALVTVHVFAVIICLIKAGVKGEIVHGKDAKTTAATRSWKASRLYRTIVRREYVGLYTLAFLLLRVVFNPDVNGAFLFSTMFLYSSIAFSVGDNVFQIWRTTSLVMRTLIIIVNVLILISNIQSFAVFQFGKIARSVGGGKPETAYITFAPQHADIAALLDVPTVKTLTLTNQLNGPIAILLRTEREIIFVNASELNALEYITNQVSVLTTNITSTRTTNYTFAVTTNTANVMVTNVIAKVSSHLATNVLTGLKANTVKNAHKVTAKQVRAEVVDAVIFTK